MKRTLIILSILFAGLQLSFAQSGNGIQGVYFTHYSTPSPVKSEDPFTLTIEGYVTTDIIRDTLKTSADVVMVLDTSGSMGDSMSETSRHSGYIKAISGSGIAPSDLEDENYYFPYSGQYRQIHSLKSSGGSYYWLYFDADDRRFFLYEETIYESTDKSTPTWNGKSGTKPSTISGGTVDSGSYNSNIWETYLFAQGTVKSKLQALVESSVVFLDSMYYYSKKYNIDNRISMVEFAGDSEIICHLSSVKTSYPSLIVHLLEFSAGGATAADYGMQDAYNELQANSIADNTKSVILFTDGEPNHGSGFSESVANSTIAVSHTLKRGDYKAIVYTVGFYQSNPGSDMDNYMQYVSSNYPDATDMDNPGSPQEGQFSHMTTDAASLVQFFAQLGQTIVSFGKPIPFTDKAKVLEQFEDYVQIPAGYNKSLIKVYTAPCTGKSGNTLTFGDRQTYSGSLNITVVEGDHGSVTISGYDYTGNWCGLRSGTTYGGNKLIVVIPGLLLDTGVYPTGVQDILENTSGLKADNDKDVAKAPSPTAELHNITITVKNMNKNESVVYTVKDETTGVVIANIDLLGPSDGGTDSATTKALNPDHKYSVTSTSWSRRDGVSGTGTTYTTLPEDKTYTVDLTSKSLPETFTDSSKNNRFTL